jgi:hypothetical protein
MIYIALIADATGRYAHVWCDAPTWVQCIDQLEDVGCEVIEDQTSEWEGCTKEEIAEDCLSVNQLINDTTFISH